MANIIRQFELIFSAKDKASKTVSTVNAAVDKVGKGIGALNDKFNAMFAVAVAQRALTFTKGVVDANDALQDLSDRTGETVENLSKMAEVAKAGDVPIETLQKAFHVLNRAMVESPEIFEAFEISVTDSSGKMKSANDIFGDVADKIASIENPARRAAAATQFFKKTGVDLLPVLKMGKDGIREWTKTVEDLGGVTSTALSKMSGEFNDNVQRIEIAGKGIANAASEQMLPYLNLLMTAFISYRKEQVELGKSMSTGGDAVKNLADNPGWKDLIEILGAVGNFIQRLIVVAKVGFAAISAVTGLMMNAIATQVQFVTAVLKGDFKGALAVVKQGIKNTADLVIATDQKLVDAFKGERFSDVLERNLGKAAKSIEAANKAAVDSTTKTASLTKNEAVKLVNASKDQIKAISTVVETASAKAKEALDNQKKTAEEFEALAKRLNKAAPKGGTFDQKFDKIGRDEGARQKKKELWEKQLETLQGETFDKRVDQLEKVAEAEKKKAEEGSKDAEKRNEDEVKAAEKAGRTLDRIDLNRQRARDYEAAQKAALRVKDAEAAVEAEKNAQKAILYQQELAKIDKEALAKQASKMEAMAIRQAATEELADITLQIKKNEKEGNRNDGEIKRLKDVGSMLEKNKEAANGVFSTEDLAAYSKQLTSLSAIATKADVEATKAAETKAFEEAKAKLELIRTSLASVPLSIDDATIVAEADRVKGILEEKLKNIVVPLKLGEYTLDEIRAGAFDKRGKDNVQKFADGTTYVRGPGGSRGDKISALLSDGEAVLNAPGMQQPGMRQLVDYVNSGGDLMDWRNGQFADASGNGYSSMGGGVNQLIVDLRTDAGSIRADRDSNQNTLDRQLRKRTLRKK